MPARAMWKAEICLGSLRVPVKLYAAIEDTTTHFRMLDQATMTPVQQQMIEPGSKTIVPSEEIQRAIQVEKGVFVVVSDEERQQLDPEPSRDITIRQVVQRAGIDDRWFDRPYYLGPDGDDGQYFALAEALLSDDELAIAQWVMRGDQYAGSVYASQGYLMLSTFRHADELAQVDRIRPEPGRTPDKRELALADQLISALADSFDPTAYQNEYRERVKDFLAKKAAGKRVRFPRRERVAASSGSLLESLEASVTQEKGSKRAAP